MKRRELLKAGAATLGTATLGTSLLGTATLALPFGATSIDALTAVDVPAAQGDGFHLFDSRYQQSADIVAENSRGGVTGVGTGTSIDRSGRWQDLHGIDPLRLWREQLLPALNAGVSITGCCTYATWHILQYSALEARHRSQLLAGAATHDGAVTLLTWQLLPR